jgi:hypothetical protein
MTGRPASAAQVGVQVKIPLFDGLSSHSQTRKNMAQGDKAESDLEVAQQTAEQLAQRACLQYAGGRSHVEALKAAVDAAQAAVDFNEGVSQGWSSPLFQRRTARLLTRLHLRTSISVFGGKLTALVAVRAQRGQRPLPFDRQ